MRRLVLALATVLALAMPGWAVQPSEVLDDPVLEERARRLSAGLRCMVCQNQSIDDSDAELARDLRMLVRERVASGESDEQVIEYVVSRYGEFVLLQPPFSLRNALLWATPALLLGLGGGFLLLRATRRNKAATARLSAEEEEAIARLMRPKPGVTTPSHYESFM